MEKNKKSGLEASFKSMYTEEWLDIHFYRPVGYQWALFFHKLGVTPNAITVASIFLGVGAAVCFAYPDWKVNLVGIFLLIWANSYDSADGQLARMTNQKSELGRILDGVCGDIWFVAIYTAICMRLTLSGASISVCWVLSPVSFIATSGYGGYYRNIHLLFLKGKAGKELAHAVSVREFITRSPFGKTDPEGVSLVLLRIIRLYQNNSPRFRSSMRLVQQKYGDSIPDVLRAEF